MAEGTGFVQPIKQLMRAFRAADNTKEFTGKMEPVSSQVWVNKGKQSIKLFLQAIERKHFYIEHN